MKLLRSLLGRSNEQVENVAADPRQHERKKKTEDLLRRQHDLARRVHVLEWQTFPDTDREVDHE